MSSKFSENIDNGAQPDSAAPDSSVDHMPSASGPSIDHMAPNSSDSTQPNAVAPDLSTHLPTNENNNPNAYVEKFKCNWAKGLRLEFLTIHIANYSAVTAEGNSCTQGYLDSIVNAYFHKFP